jgi:hypothetical protein
MLTSSSDVAQGNPDTDVESSEVGSEDENSEKAAEISENEESEEEEDSVEENYDGRFSRRRRFSTKKNLIWNQSLRN